MINSNIFKPFYGVVEKIVDKEKSSRVQVRIFGHHTDKTVLDASSGKGIPPDDLPWARVLTSSGVHGFGWTHDLVEGSWVFGFSMDGDVFNDLLIIGAIPGTPEEKNPNPASPPKAFHGQDGLWPNEEFLNEPDVSRLARGVLKYKKDEWKPIPIIKEENQEKGISKADGGTWDEKDHGFGAEYPRNKVFETPGRHTIEFDDTPGAERISIWHGKAHSFIDFHKDGSIQIKAQGDNYSIALKDHNIYAKGEVNITAEKVNVLSTGDTKVKSEGKCEVESAEDCTIRSEGIVQLDGAKAVSIKSATLISLVSPLIKLAGKLI